MVEVVALHFVLAIKQMKDGRDDLDPPLGSPTDLNATRNTCPLYVYYCWEWLQPLAAAVDVQPS